MRSLGISRDPEEWEVPGFEKRQILDLKMESCQRSANLCLRKCQGASNRLYDYTNDPSLESYPPVLDIWNVQSSAPSADAFSIAPRGRWEKHGALVSGRFPYFLSVNQCVRKCYGATNRLYDYTNDSSLERYPPMLHLSTTPGFEPAIFGYVDPRDVHCARRPLGKTLRAEKRAKLNHVNIRIH
ncbi:hypothetical protein Tcan_12560 [Toxocara canis]|uniref:Uncharacterized protein n=1 Tax=Toxocara canis TaxID=6265 RepID=A0A0B2UPY4_TOXCA|nr:hypothetical protein Tcan_12560 [Toxocara canis]